MKILMATMSLDIGGAETHIVELSRELTRRGHSVTVVSRGGMYVPELEAQGIRHISLPLNTKRLSAVIRSYIGLKRLISQENFDIVHAHARIPAFICGLLAKRMHFRFITSAHGVFKVTPYWRAISNWGRKTLAVSCDIKQYLIQHYGINSDNITLTINGIDTDRFAPRPEMREKMEDTLGLGRTAHRLIYVSRIDREAAHVGFYLCQALPALLAAIPDLEIVIVGGGTAWEDLKRASDAANEQAGRKAVVLTGPRTDIADILQVADGYIGVSRAALEAMATGLPVILAGSQGRIGIFDQKQLKLALDTNFCCRGLTLPDEHSVCQDVLALFGQDKSVRQEMGEYNRRVVMENYSVARMAGDAEKVYNEMMTHTYAGQGEVILSGYYGFGNTGDDSLLSVITQQLRRTMPGIKLTVLSKNPRLTAQAYDVRALNRFNFLAIAREARHARLLISGSGNLIQNSTSTRSLIYYVTIMKTCKKRSAKVMLYASGIGPLLGNYAHKLAKGALEQTDLITLRDGQSEETLTELGICGKHIRMTADPACLIEAADPAWISYLCAREGLQPGVPYFAVALRPWNDTAKGYEKIITQAIRTIEERFGMKPVLISMQKSKDDEVCRRIAGVFDAPVLSGLTASELVGVLSSVQFVIGMRLHTLIYAADAAVPFIGLAYDLKINAMTEQYGMAEYNLDVRTVSEEQLVDAAERILHNHEALSAQIGHVHEQMVKLAEQDAALAISLLNE